VKRARIVWTVVFLGITLVAIVMEVVAGIWEPAGTIPWTEYIAQYVPWPFQLAAYVILAVWLPFHFWRHDHLRKEAFDQGVRMAKRAALGLDRPVGPGIKNASSQDLQRELVSRGYYMASRLSPYGGEPMCSHGHVFGRTQHHCGELPSDAVRFTPGRSNGR
jgi:hypothetical protein